MYRAMLDLAYSYWSNVGAFWGIPANGPQARAGGPYRAWLDQSYSYWSNLGSYWGIPANPQGLAGQPTGSASAPPAPTAQPVVCENCRKDETSCECWCNRCGGERGKCPCGEKDSEWQPPVLEEDGTAARQQPGPVVEPAPA
jgi:hypothetical protein